MSFSTIRRRIAVCSTIVLASTFTAAHADAQTASKGAGWGAEGRIGGPWDVYLARWFSDDWALLVGGSVSASSIKRDGSSDKNENKNATAYALLRRSWGSAAVRPFLAAGPTLNIGRSTYTNSFNDITNTQKEEATGIGARGEFGATIPVTSSTYFGLSSGVSYGHNTNESTSAGGTKTKSSGNGFSAGNLQFMIGFRF